MTSDLPRTFGPGATPIAPADREGARAALLQTFESVRDVIEETADETERGRTLAPRAVDAFRESGLFAFKVPREVGGAEADLVVQMDLIEAATLVDPAAAWSMLICSAVTGAATARVGDEALAEMYEGGRLPCMAGTLRPDGRATKVDGGYRISGRWAWGSGIHHADWVSVLTFVDGPSPVISAVVPIADIEVHDNWHVMGMKGTGSSDYTLDDVFVPEHRVVAFGEPQQRGGLIYRLGAPGYVVNEHMVFALALAKRALCQLREYAVEKKRGYGSGTTIADRPSVQRLISEGQLRLQGCRLLCDDVLDRMVESAADGPPDPRIVAEARAISTLCTDEALSVTSEAFRHAGGQAVYLDSVFERCLRDLYTVQSHFVVHDSSYEQHGQMLMGLLDQSSMS